MSPSDSTHSRATTPRPIGLGAIAIVLGMAAAIAVEAFVFSFVMVLLSMNVAGCSELRPCNYALDTASIVLTPIAGTVAVIITLVFPLINVRRGRPMWPAFVVSAVLVVVAILVSFVLNHIALGPLVG